MTDSFYSAMCPAKINLLGEQLDYNDGTVITFPLDYKFKMEMEIDPSDRIQVMFDKKAAVFSVCNGKIQSYKNVCPEIEDILQEISDIISNKKNHHIKGFKAYYNFDTGESYDDHRFIAFSILTFKGINELMKLGLSDEEIENDIESLWSVKRKSRRSFTDIRTMMRSRKGYVNIINENTLKNNYVRANFKGYAIVIAYNNKILKSIFPQKVKQQCRMALKQMKKAVNVESLSSLSVNEFERFKGIISDEGLIDTASHIVYENNRVQKGIKLLKSGNIESFGILMSECHDSLIRFYDEEDERQGYLHSLALSSGLCLGNKITEWTMGMCSLSLIKDNDIEAFKERLSKGYREEFDEELRFYSTPIYGQNTELPPN